MKYLLILASLFLIGCGNLPLLEPVEPKYETVTIVLIGTERRVGHCDDYTILERPNSTRYFECGHWGAVGDIFKVRTQ